MSERFLYDCKQKKYSKDSVETEQVYEYIKIFHFQSAFCINWEIIWKKIPPKVKTNNSIYSTYENNSRSHVAT